MGKVLFIGLGRAAVCWYRCALPAQALGHDWIGVSPDFNVETGNLPKVPRIEDYDTFVCQQPRGAKWERRIDILHGRGARVICETDDFLHGIRMHDDHASSRHFTPRVMKEYDRCMAMCDEVIVSTPYLAEQYRHVNPHVTVCPNGIDLERYAFAKPQRDFVTVGWAGATGHQGAIRAWMEGGILDAMRDHPTSQFLAIGYPQAASLALEQLGDDRALGIPWGPLETYPAAMASIDVFLAPAGQAKWYRGKSDLRWMEAAALGAPCICAPRLYPEADHVASSPEEAARILRSFLEQPAGIPAAGESARERLITSSRMFPEAARPWALTLRG